LYTILKMPCISHTEHMKYVDANWKEIWGTTIATVIFYSIVHEIIAYVIKTYSERSLKADKNHTMKHYEALSPTKKIEYI